MGKIFSDINCSNVFLGQSPKAIEIKAKINKRDLVKLTHFCTAEETVNKMKRRPTEWEKIFAIDASNKDLITKIYEQLIQLNNNNNKNQKVGRRPKRHTDGQEAHDQVLSIASCQRNVNQSQN